jgi:hypothetical protein
VPEYKLQLHFQVLRNCVINHYDAWRGKACTPTPWPKSSANALAMSVWQKKTPAYAGFFLSESNEFCRQFAANGAFLFA